MSRTMTYAEAVREAMATAMTNDERVFLMGEDVGVYGGAFGVSNDLYERFGTDRVRDTTISELGIVGMGVGAALTGMRPIVEIQFSDFLCQAMDQVVNQAAKLHFMVGGQAEVPLVIRAPGGSGTGAAAQHSQSLEAWFAHVPGLKVVMPSNATDAGSLLLAALDDPNPVLVLEHKLLYKQSFEVPDEFPSARLGEGRIEREGSDLTIVATSVEVQRSVQAAEQLAEQGISAEVIDPRTIKPLDVPLILQSVARTGRVLLVQEAPKFAGFMAEVAATIAESEVFGDLQAPIRRLCGLDTPIPYSPTLEKASVPQVDDIVREAAALVGEW
ncbi:alpha-ketoacid dehydrogenase subunit beta [Micropruina glycogenica]|uniref:Acetoin dehydrogenase E1 component (TPP-dependent beta subunit) n=1 Tax=Micropruina glycogenica TaxID=75385 RepID=A0A2N9JL77_9ACTN|nr:alpha-ketoacid dehydrogenase subunit beta [Micropruina glycogenica]SPD88795.1 acetoin dehydrogenase E1 component (TPP-dependent beta subunit) [Micropruina glycogenica]